MAKPEITAGLDMGSGRVTCVIGSPDPEGRGMHVLGGASVPCRWLKGGVVVNINETARAVRLAVEKAEQDAEQMVHGLHLGIWAAICSRSTTTGPTTSPGPTRRSRRTTCGR